MRIILFLFLLLVMKNMMGLSAQYFVICLLFWFSHLHAAYSLPFKNSTSSIKHCCSPEESLALLHFKNSFSISDDYPCYECDLSSNRKTESWKEGSDCCTWEGVTCDMLTGRVIGLDLSCGGLLGSLHDDSSLFRLHHLQRLNLACNNFSQTKISSNFGGFSKLSLLNLSSSSLLGPLPAEITHLSKLISLDLTTDYDITLDQPTFDKLLKNLTQIRTLILVRVDMLSVVPESLTNVSTSLRSLNLGGTRLQGKFPVELFHLPLLQRLILSVNGDLTGELPKSNWSCPLEVLELRASGFSGILPDTIGNLRYLEALDLSYSRFTGNVPASLSNLQQLRLLDLSWNTFTGEFPDVFGNLSKITDITLSENKFSGQFPSSVFNSTQLRSLLLRDNQFSGHLPNHVSDLSHLTELDLSSNCINGRLPSWLFALPLLGTLPLSYNNLSGFTEFEQFQQPSTSLTDVDLSHNQLHGPIPIFIFELVNLYRIDLGHNQLHGPVPNQIFERVNLSFIDLSQNELSGVIKADMLAKLKNLFSFDLSHNYRLSLTNTDNENFTLPNLISFEFSSCNLTVFPFFLRKAEKLMILDLSNNSIFGQVSLNGTNFWPELYSIDLSQNFLTSFEFDNSSSRNWRYVDLHSNLLRGSLMFPSSSFLPFFSVSHNKLSGEIPSSFCNLSSINFLVLFNNTISGRIPQCLGNLDHLEVLNLGMNNLGGNIPLTFTEGCQLMSLNLNDNQFDGQLPPSLVNCTMLEVLDVGNNKISGTFPHMMTTLPELQVLILRSNRLHGPIRDLQTRYHPFAKLRIIDISHNAFTGHLPAILFENFKIMINGDGDMVDLNYITYWADRDGHYYRDSVLLTMKGINVQFERILYTFMAIDLSCNQFQGPIPSVVGNLKLLKVLNFSHNNFKGHIPMSLRNLKELESLDLSSNKLVGRIPLELRSLTGLEWLNVSYNNLTGHIPQGLQFNTFDNSSYIGNLGLCGPPLSKVCDNGGPPVPSTFNEEEEDDTWNWFWKIATMGYGCGVVIGVSTTYMIFATGRPFWVIKLYERLRQPRRNLKRSRERCRGGRGN